MGKLPIKMDCNFCDNLELATHPEKVANIFNNGINGGEISENAQVMAGSLDLVNTFLKFAQKATKFTTGSAFGASLGANLEKAQREYSGAIQGKEHLKGKISNQTLLAIMSDLSGLVGSVPIPQIKALGILGGFSLGMASLLASDSDTDMFDSVYDLLKPFFDDMNDMVNSDETLKKTFDCPFIAIPNKTVFENDGIAEITIFLPNPIDRDLKLTLSTMDGSAKNGSDFIAQEQEIIIPAASNSYTHKIQIIRDGNYEGREDFGIKVTIDRQTAQEVGLDSNVYTSYVDIIDFPNETCPKPVTPTFSLNFPLPSSPSVYYPGPI